MTNFYNLSTYDRDTDKTLGLYKHTFWFALYMNKILKFKNSGNGNKAIVYLVRKHCSEKSGPTARAATKLLSL